MAADVSGVLEEARKACGKLQGRVAIERIRRNWEIRGVSVDSVGVTDADMQRLSRVRTATSIEVPGIHPGDMRVTDAGIMYLRAIPNLRYLRPPMNTTPKALRAIASLGSIERLDLSYCRDIMGGGLGCLKGLGRLRSLVLEGVGLSDRSLEELRALEGLEELGLAMNPRVSDSGMRALRSLGSLRNLDVRGTKVSAKALLKLLHGKGRIESLAVGGYGERSQLAMGPLDLSSVTSLSNVDVGTLCGGDIGGIRFPDGVRKITAPLALAERLDVASAPKRLRALQIVLLRQDDRVSMSGLAGLSGLQEVTIKDYSNKDNAVAEITRLKQVRSLTIAGGCARIQNRSVRAIGNMRQLKSLRIGNASLVTVAGIRSLMGLRNLRALCLHEVAREAARGLGRIGQLESLRRFELGSRPGQQVAVSELLADVKSLRQVIDLTLIGMLVTDGWLEELVVLRGLEKIDISQCTGYTNRGIETLMRSLPKLKVVKVHYGAE